MNQKNYLMVHKVQCPRINVTKQQNITSNKILQLNVLTTFNTGSVSMKKNNNNPEWPQQRCWQTDFQNVCTAKKPIKFTTRFIRHYPPHLKHVATLPWEIKYSCFANIQQIWNKCLANAKRPCACSVMCLRPKGSLCSFPHYEHIVLFTAKCYRLTEHVVISMHGSRNNGVGQFKPTLQVEGNIFRPIFFGYFIADWLLYNFAAGSFHTTKLCSRLIEIEFYPEKLKIAFWATL